MEQKIGAPKGTSGAVDVEPDPSTKKCDATCINATKGKIVNLIILILDLYIAAHAVWWFLQETNRASRHSLTPFLSRTCNPFCRLFNNVELIIRGNNATRAVPVLALAAIRLLLVALF